MSDLLDENYWQNRYEKLDTGWDAGRITTPIKEFVDGLTDKSLKILIPGAGNAHEAEYIWKAGFHNIYVMDIAQAPLTNLKQRLPDFPDQQLLHTDFFTHEGQYDIIIEQTFFCALDPSFRPGYAAQMHKLLKPGGRLCGVFFGVPMNADQPPFGGSKEEYISYFSPLFTSVSIELCQNSISKRAGNELWVELIN
jgi:SAM-dependent methyltransferase